MITQLSGHIVRLDLSYLVLDVGGVGYQIFASIRMLGHVGQKGDQVTLLTELAVKEESLTLYGFVDEHERGAFRLLQTVQGVGAKAALSILSSLSVEQVIQAILSADKAMVSRADGIGPKLALRIVNELAQKTGSLTGSMPAGTIDLADQSDPGKPDSDRRGGPQGEEALSALINLGYSRSEAYLTVNQIIAQLDEPDLSAIITAALKQLGKAR